MNKTLDEKHKENAKKALAEAKARKKKEIAILRAKEKNGPKGLEPTRYGDWEKRYNLRLLKLTPLDTPTNTNIQLTDRDCPTL